MILQSDTANEIRLWIKEEYGKMEPFAFDTGMYPGDLSRRLNSKLGITDDFVKALPTHLRKKVLDDYCAEKSKDWNLI